jgi:hypothetical protein
MRPTPIPEAEVWDGGVRVVFAAPDGDLTNPDIAPVEVVADRADDGVTPRFHVRAVLEAGDLETLAAGGNVWLTMWGTVVPFAVDVRPGPSPYGRLALNRGPDVPDGG